MHIIENLEPDAWKAPAVTEVLEALYQLAERGYLLPGWEGLDHIQSQNEWLQGKAVFIPVGTWLENEMKDSIPEGFNMVIAPTPSLPGDKLPFAAISAGAGEPFIVPSQGKNVPGGKEWLRLLFSKEAGRVFAENTRPSARSSILAGRCQHCSLGHRRGRHLVERRLLHGHLSGRDAVDPRLVLRGGHPGRGIRGPRSTSAFPSSGRTLCT